MRSYLYHIQLNVDYKKNNKFYKDLFSFLGWQPIEEEENAIGFISEKDEILWFDGTNEKSYSNYDSIGINHITIRVGKKKDVDECMSFLKQNQIRMLFGTPKQRPEYVANIDNIYYQIMFESPDKILFEIVYVGPT